MKKSILKVFGVAALAAGILYNVQVFDTEIGSGISLAAIGNVAVANSESGGQRFYRVSYSETISSNSFQYKCGNEYRTGYTITTKSSTTCIRGGIDSCSPSISITTTTTRPC